MKAKTEYNKKNKIADLILLLFPHIFIFGAICAVFVWVFTTFIASNSYFSFVVVPDPVAIPFESSAIDSEVIAPPPVQAEEFPAIAYETQWATLNVSGWRKRDIPVYFGDNDRMLSLGAGLWIGSRFCGQGGKIVLSSHVTNHFYEIEDVSVGTVVTMDTIYGTYEYKVRDIVVFDYKDSSLLRPDDSSETLVMYTCYPRVNGFDFKTQRIALVCDKISGKDYAG